MSRQRRLPSTGLQAQCDVQHPPARDGVDERHFIGAGWRPDRGGADPGGSARTLAEKESFKA